MSATLNWKAKVVSRLLKPSSACECASPGSVGRRTCLTPVNVTSTEDQKQKDAQELFDFCAECLNNFIGDHFANEDGVVELAEPLALGFTFSYPCLQEKIDHGVLIRWTKGFGAPGAEGKDCAAMFQQSLDKFVRTTVYLAYSFSSIELMSPPCLFRTFLSLLSL